MIFEIPIEHYPGSDRVAAIHTASAHPLNGGLNDRKYSSRLSINTLHCKDNSSDIVPIGTSVCRSEFQFPKCRFTTAPTLKRAMTSPLIILPTTPVSELIGGEVPNHIQSPADSRPGSSLGNATNTIHRMSVVELGHSDTYMNDNMFGSTPCLRTSIMQSMLGKGLSCLFLSE